MLSFHLQAFRQDVSPESPWSTSTVLSIDCFSKAVVAQNPASLHVLLKYKALEIKVKIVNQIGKAIC